MNKILLFLLCLLGISLVSVSQNLGQYQENNVIKLEYFQYSNGKHTFKITNKVNCVTNITVDKYDNSTTNHSIPGNSYMFVDIIGAQSTIFKIRTKRVSGSLCSSNPDNGWVEIESPLVLPVSFQTRIGYCLFPDKTIDLQFTVEQTSDVKIYYVKYSSDAKTFKQIQTVTPNKLVGTQTYKTKIK